MVLSNVGLRSEPFSEYVSAAETTATLSQSTTSVSSSDMVLASTSISYLKGRLNRVSTMLVALLTMFCVTVLNGYHVAHPDNHSPSSTQIVVVDHHAAHADYGGTDRDEGNDDDLNQFASHAAQHAVSLADPIVLVLGSIIIFPRWHPMIVAIVASIDPPGHLRPPRS